MSYYYQTERETAKTTLDLEREIQKPKKAEAEVGGASSFPGADFGALRMLIKPRWETREILISSTQLRFKDITRN